MEFILLIIGAIVLMTILGKPKVDEAYEQYEKDCKVANKEVTHNPNRWGVSVTLAVITMILLIVAIGSISSTGMLPLPTN